MDNDYDITAFTLRNPPFTKAEINTLIDLVEEHKSVLLDKATKAAACYAKEAAWTAIGDSFHARGFPYKRTTESLKLKWDNIKKSTRKKAKESLNGHYDPVTNRLIKLLGDHNLLYDLRSGRVPDCSMDDEDGSVDATENLDSEVNLRNNSEDSHNLSTSVSNENEEPNNEPLIKLRSYNESNFTELECERLMICVKPERQYALSKETSARMKEFKNRAWERIAATFNRNKIDKRSTKCLRKKFESMKNLAGKLKTNDSDNSNIFTNNSNIDKPNSVCKMEKTEIDVNYENYAEDGNDDSENFLIAALHNDNSNPHPKSMSPEDISDPLGNALNGFSQHDNAEYNKDVQKLVKLKIELARYKLEMAKESSRQRKEAHEALLASIAARTRLAVLETKKTELEIAALSTKGNIEFQNDTII